MNSKDTNPNANVPEQQQNAPLGDRGQGDKTWTPGEEQGISNRLGDEAEEEKDGEDDDFDEDDDEDAEEDEDAEGDEAEEPTDASKE